MLNFFEIHVKVIIYIYLDRRAKCIWYANHIPLEIAYRYSPAVWVYNPIFPDTIFFIVIKLFDIVIG